MTERRYLVDTSVLARASQAGVADRLDALRLKGRLWTCRVVDVEYARASRARQVSDVVAERLQLPEAPLTPAVGDRALDLAVALADAGMHRGAKTADLLIAAAAEAAGVAVLHYDRDFERIAAVTGLHCEWVGEPGTLDGQAN